MGPRESGRKQERRVSLEKRGKPKEWVAAPALPGRDQRGKERIRRDRRQGFIQRKLIGRDVKPHGEFQAVQSHPHGNPLKSQGRANFGEDLFLLGDEFGNTFCLYNRNFGFEIVGTGAERDPDVFELDFSGATGAHAAQIVVLQEIHRFEDHGEPLHIRFGVGKAIALVDGVDEFAGTENRAGRNAFHRPRVGLGGDTVNGDLGFDLRIGAIQG